MMITLVLEMSNQSKGTDALLWLGLTEIVKIVMAWANELSDHTPLMVSVVVQLVLVLSLTSHAL